ncbi:MAG: hypothetical protein OXC63_08345 [Aestuariivita sp.]|nr:hypothetical protein [Aestuariivita sp.]MCY4345401.1 hypothetical protein [Aestuariivita sp.]
MTAATQATDRATDLGRHPPPDRRPCETRKLHWQGQSVFITVGYREDFRTPCEIFYDAGYKSGSDMEAMISDICILLSIWLQVPNNSPDELKKSLSENITHATGEFGPGSIFGLLLHEIFDPPHWLKKAEVQGKPKNAESGV